MIAAGQDLATEVREKGFAIVDEVLSRSVVNDLLTALEETDHSGSERKHGSVFAIRNLLDTSPEVRALAWSETLRAMIEPVLGTKYFPVRGILFDKVPGANWKVPWHQDVTISVQERRETEGFGPWSIKADVLHVQPPASILENMLSVRLHLDTCASDNGALRVVPKSHLRGRIPEQGIESLRALGAEHICAVPIGGALIMRPLLLHASGPSLKPVHRRVVHLDFASVALPNGLRWLSQ